MNKDNVDKYFDNPIEAPVIIEAPEPREIIY